MMNNHKMASTTATSSSSSSSSSSSTTTSIGELDSGGPPNKKPKINTTPIFNNQNDLPNDIDPLLLLEDALPAELEDMNNGATTSLALDQQFLKQPPQQQQQPQPSLQPQHQTINLKATGLNKQVTQQQNLITNPNTKLINTSNQLQQPQFKTVTQQQQQQFHNVNNINQINLLIQQNATNNNNNTNNSNTNVNNINNNNNNRFNNVPPNATIYTPSSSTNNINLPNINSTITTTTTTNMNRINVLQPGTSALQNVLGPSNTGSLQQITNTGILKTNTVLGNQLLNQNRLLSQQQQPVALGTPPPNTQIIDLGFNTNNNNPQQQLMNNNNNPNMRIIRTNTPATNPQINSNTVLQQTNQPPAPHTTPPPPSITQQQQQQQQQQVQQQQQQQQQPQQQAANDPEKRKLIQQQLVLLLHAHKCQLRSDSANVCRVPHCQIMKSVLQHMTQCTEGRNCTVAHCSSSRQIISHWKNCTRAECPVCKPLRNASNHRNTGASNLAANNATNANAVSTVNSLNNNYSNLTNGSLPPGHQQQVLSLQQSTLQQSLINNSQLTNPQVPTVSKSWHEKITPEMRKHLVQKIAQTILPTTDETLKDKRMVGLLEYASRTEFEMYEQAKDQEEYFHLLAERIYKIQKDIEDRRNAKKQQQQPGMQATNTSQTNFNNNNSNNNSSTLNTNNSNQYPNKIKNPYDPDLLAGNEGPPNKVAPFTTSTNQINTNFGSKNPFINIKQESDLTQFTTNFNQGNSTIISNNNNNNSINFQLNNSQQNNLLLNSSLGANSAQSPFNNLGTVQNNLNNSNSSNSNSFLLSQNPQQQLQNNQSTHSLPTLDNTDFINTYDKEIVISANGDQLNDFKTDIKKEPSDNQFLINTNPGSLKTEPLKAEMISPNKSVVKKESSIPSVPPVSNNNNNTSMDAPFSINNQQQDSKDIKDDLANTSVIASSSSGSTSNSNNNSNNNPSNATASATASSSTAASASTIPSASSTSNLGSLLSKCKTPTKFTPEELREKLMPTFEKLYQLPEAPPFHVPVNPIELNLPDYFDVIKKPMDLSTIKTKLDEGKYSNPQEYVDDVWLMLNNAWMYNKKTSKVYKCCTKLSEVFSACIDPVMQSMGYCCGQQYTFSPQVLFCYGNQMCCTIPRDASYYLYINENQSLPNANCDKYTYCTKCFDSIKSDMVPIGDDPSQPLHEIRKTLFVPMKNDHEEQEAFVECAECGRKWHQICALHMDQIFSKFVCDTCIKNDKTGRLKQMLNRYTSSKLTRTRLGDFLENRVNSFLKTREHECTQRPGRVTIRILSAVEKTCEIKSLMRNRYENELATESYPFKTKAIFAFEEIDGVDVVFFGMHVQEYGSECPAPNTRRVYISYLDSVFFFRPKELRTAVYHELLIGYLDYVKQQGFQWAHIWACPPSEGDDYIFHCHPPDQKVPKPKRLQDWYKKMLDKGIIERVVIDYKDIHKDAVENGFKSPIEIPYFEGDFWPNVLEECIKEQEQEEEKRRKEAEAEAAKSQNDLSDIYGTEDTLDGMDGPSSASSGFNQANSNGKKKSNLTQKKKNIKSKMSSSQRKNTTKSKSLASSTNDILSKILSNMEKHKEVFFVIRLLESKQVANMSSIHDPDPCISCDLMNGRDEFLNFARERHHEFSSLRRAKYSTMALLYELHNQGNNDKFDYTCNKCNTKMVSRYHCTVCHDYDLCATCFERTGHEHRMEKLETASIANSANSEDKQSTLNGDNKSSLNAANANTKPTKHSIETYLNAFMHAVYCRNANCNYPKCMQFKRVVQHSKNCNKFKNSQCEFCKQMIALCIYHAKNCKENMCQVPFCSTIKVKLKQQKAYNTQAERRRMHMMTQTFRNAAQSNNTNTDDSPAPSNSATTSIDTSIQQQPQQQQIQQNSMYNNQMQYGANNMPQNTYNNQNMMNTNNPGNMYGNMSGGMVGGQNNNNLMGNMNMMRPDQQQNMNTIGIHQNMNHDMNTNQPQQTQQQQQQYQQMMQNKHPSMLNMTQAQQPQNLNINSPGNVIQQNMNFQQPNRPLSASNNQMNLPQQQQRSFDPSMNDNNNMWSQSQPSQQRIMSNQISSQPPPLPTPPPNSQFMQQQQQQPGSNMINNNQMRPNNSNDYVNAYVERIRSCKQPEEKQKLIAEIRTNPQLFQRVVNVLNEQQQQKLNDPTKIQQNISGHNVIIINNNQPQQGPPQQQQQQNHLQQWQTNNPQQQQQQQFTHNQQYVNTQQPPQQQQMHNNIRYQNINPTQLNQPRQQYLINNSQSQQQQQMFIQQQPPQQQRFQQIQTSQIRHQNSGNFTNLRQPVNYNPLQQQQQQQQQMGGYTNTIDNNNSNQMLLQTPNINSFQNQQQAQQQQQQQQQMLTDKLSQVVETL